ncbi:hypothetical protein ACIRD3_39485 [Kitasatospora sp. NPDC093550]|uniref:hypothetical protein n=1 Tax=Kitasatospora sp. NPDC093550 TaxID=3364089 RepID=UPI00382B6EA3
MPDQITQAVDQVRTGLQSLATLSATGGDDVRLAVLRQLWTRHGSTEDGIVQELGKVLTALVTGLTPNAAASASYTEEAAIVLEDVVGGDHIERAQLLLAEQLLDAGTSPSYDPDGDTITLIGWVEPGEGFGDTIGPCLFE